MERTSRSTIGRSYEGMGCLSEEDWDREEGRRKKKKKKRVKEKPVVPLNRPVMYRARKKEQKRMIKHHEGGDLVGSNAKKQPPKRMKIA